MKPFDVVKPYFLEEKKRILFGLLTLIVVDFLQLLIPRIIKWAVDDLTLKVSTETALLKYAGYIAGTGILIGILRYVWRLFLFSASRRVEEGLRNDLYRHIQTLSAPYFDRVRTGDLMARTTNDIRNIQMASGMGLVALNDGILLGIAAVCFMAYIDVRLTALVLVPMPVIAILTRIITKKLHTQHQEVQVCFSELTECARERFTGIRIIKAHGRENEAVESLRRESKVYIDKNIRLMRVLGIFFPMMALISELSLVIVLWIGGKYTILAAITPGDFVAFISYIGILTWPMMALGWVTNLIQRGKSSLERIMEILETRPDIDEPRSAIPISDIEKELRFRNVSFSHGKGDESGFPEVLSGIDVTIDRGGILGLVGPPGSGKTTLFSLIPRLYDPTRGEIFIDGRNIRDIRVDNLRSMVSFMPQEPFIFDGTIRENITLGDDAIPADRVIQAAAEAEIYETILSFPKGFDTIVGEKGVILSGGQKQRIALARVFLRKTPILIFDDPISQVDVRTGKKIINRIRSLSGKRTILIASHRISAVSFADRIITLKQGRIIESGSHETLVRNGSYYAEMFRLQEIEES